MNQNTIDEISEQDQNVNSRAQNRIAKEGHVHQGKTSNLEEKENRLNILTWNFEFLWQKISYVWKGMSLTIPEGLLWYSWSIARVDKF